MSERDRFGVNGFLSMIRRENSDPSGLLMGIDLNSLGLELQRPE